jgi:hypothetical protein
MSNDIDLDRRRFFGAAATTIAATCSRANGW